MTRFRLALLSVVGVTLPLWGPGAALAQAPVPLAADRAQLSACLRDNRAGTPACIGSIAVACVGAASTDRRGAEVGCARREEAVWRERLIQAVQQSGRALDAGQRSRLVALQLSWEGFIAQKCAFYGSTQREGLQLGRQAGCELREVASRTLELERTTMRQAPTRRPSQPPQIIR
ncbi:lysozyme inhibitor LprI family protein [Bosea sp. AAP35]|uniref:lysozyme inhibitor LprI family protein n=1 Tax=Bosea sp. AAP35 TaxID=1523417 RepID=UPI0018D02432|nr:lysozyme inhibitor LprI family protein [Bosea sp. AAP35]